jgi:galactose mutarotase-like enzyme
MFDGFWSGFWMPRSASILKTSVGGLKGIVIENEKLRVVVLPDLGGRIISLIYKPTEAEFAWHCPDVPFKKPDHQIEYENVSGFFDCLPTTDPCTFKEKKLPAAGEVAFEPWNVLKAEKRLSGVTLKMDCTCKIYPLRINKEVSLNKDESILRLRYTIRNLSDEKLEYNYSAHNTMQVSPHHRIILPHEVMKVKHGFSTTDRLGKPGDEVSWPQAMDKNGRTVDISKIGSPCDGFGESLYTPRLKERWAAVLNEARKEAIAFSWSGEALPYLQIWANNGGWRRYYHAALEPSTGRPDNLEMAVSQWKEYATLEPKQKVTWKENIILAHGIEHVEKIENDGIVQR